MSAGNDMAVTNFRGRLEVRLIPGASYDVHQARGVLFRGGGGALGHVLFGALPPWSAPPMEILVSGSTSSLGRSIGAIDRRRRRIISPKKVNKTFIESGPKKGQQKSPSRPVALLQPRTLQITMCALSELSPMTIF